MKSVKVEKNRIQTVFAKTKTKNAQKRACYKLISENLNNPYIGDYQSYGIEICDASDQKLRTVSDISTDRLSVETLIKRCNESGLEPIHLMDIIEDMIPV